MSKYIRQFGAPLMLTAALVLGATACGDDDGDLADTAALVDTALNNDLVLAGQDTAALPELTDVPAAGAPAPVATTPRTTRPTTTTTRRTPTTTTRTPTTTTTPSGNTVTRDAPGSEPAAAVIPAGTSLAFVSNSKVCTNTNKVGDTFTASLAQPVTVNGVTIPEGATARITVTELKGSENVNDNVVMGFRVVSISWGGRTYTMDTEVTSVAVNKVRTSTRKDDAKKVVGGAVIGAIAGQVLGKDTKGTVTGAAAGAAAGTAAAIATGDYAGCVNQGGRIVIRTTEAARVVAD